MRCHVFVGKLVSHPCGRDTEKSCGSCGKPVCALHQAPGGNCVVCARTYMPPPAPVKLTEQDMLSFTDDEIDAFVKPVSGPSLGNADS